MAIRVVREPFIDDAYPQRRADATNHIEARHRIGAERPVQRLASNARCLGNLAHAARTGHAAERNRLRGRVVFFQDNRQVFGHFLLAVPMLGDVEFR